MLAIKKINNTSLAIQPLSDGYSVTTSDLLSDSSGRSAETGTALRYLVRANTFKLSLKFKGPSSDIASVNTLVSSFAQTVEFLYKGSYLSKNFYPSDRSVTDDGETAELSVNLIEI